MAREYARNHADDRKAYMEVYREENREELLQHGREYYHANQDRSLVMMKQYRDANREILNAKKREFHEVHKDTINAKRKQWYDNLSPDEKEEYLAKHREYYSNNAEQMKAYHRQWNKENLDKGLINQNKRRAMKAQLNENFTYDDYIYVRELFNDSCANCGSTENLHLDHHRPLSKGNPLTRENAVLLCATCNYKKHKRDPEVFYPQEKLQEIESKLFQGNRRAG